MGNSEPEERDPAAERRHANRAYFSWVERRTVLWSLGLGSGSARQKLASGRATIAGTKLPQIAALGGRELAEVRRRHPDLAPQPWGGVRLDEPAATLRTLRLQRGWTVAELADAADVRPYDIRRYEEGTATPGPKVGAGVVAALGLTPEEFADRFPQVPRRVRGWDVVVAHDVRYFPVASAELVVRVWGTMPAPPPGVRDLLYGVAADELAAPDDVVPAAATATLRRGTPPSALVAGLRDRFPTHTEGDGGRAADNWEVWFPASGRLFPTANQDNNRMVDRSHFVAPPSEDLDAYAEWARREVPVAQLAGPGTELLVALDDHPDTPFYALRVETATTDVTGTVPARPSTPD